MTKKLEATVNNLPRRRQMAEGAHLLLEACAGDFQLAVEALIAIQEQGVAQVTYSLAEVRNGTGWPNGVRFAVVTEGGDDAS